MKQVAGTLRIDLAQFRELEAFAQFGSDLDKATQQQLSRGRRMVEILKQPQYQPLPMVKQVTILYAATQGFLDKYPVESLADYEKQLYDFIEASHAALFEELEQKQAFDDELEAKFKKVLEEFDGVFGAQQ
jgi:F-type H+-transporting ATPase subunit alpha